MRVIIAFIVALGLSGLTLQAGENAYSVQNQWGGASASWNQGGSWVIGGRITQRVINVDVISYDRGNSLVGTMQYQGEGTIGFKAQRTAGDSWNVQIQWGGPSASWNQEGIWTIGARVTQPVVRLLISSTDNGANLNGFMAYKGERLIGFRAQLAYI